MLGLMQSQPLLISSLIHFAERHHGDAEIVSRRVEGDLHRYTWRDVAARSRLLPVHILLTKCDKLGRGAAMDVLHAVRKGLADHRAAASVQLFSSTERIGLDVATKWVEERLGIALPKSSTEAM